MKTSLRRPLVLAAAGSLAVSAASAQSTLITDDFETNTSANYVIGDDGNVDGVRDFGFDYIAAGIPLAPRSAAGDSGGLRLTVNETGGTPNAVTCFHNMTVDADNYTLTVDVWSNFLLGSSGTTEHAHVGVGGDGITFNQLFSPVSGSGAFIAFDGDGDSGSDYRWFRDAANTPMGETDSTTLPNSHPSYLGNGSNNTGAFFQTLFPSPPSTIAGSPGNIWTTVEVNVDNDAGQISFFFDGTLTFQGDFADRFDGQVSLGLGDVFSSIATDTFVVFDNLEVVSNSGFGTNYCLAAVNSTGVAGDMSATGSLNVADNNVTLTASGLPNTSFGFFIVSANQGFVGMPGGSSGNLCLSGAIGRYVGPGQIQNTGTIGAFSLMIDLTTVPSPMGPVGTSVGDTWNFQAWFRDSNMSGATSNFTDGLEVTFL